LRIHAELVQLKSNFTVLDVDDQIRLLKQLLQAENIDDKRWPARTLAGLIDGWKNRGLMPSQVPPGEAAVFGNGKGGKLYASYQERLRSELVQLKSNFTVLDVDDQIRLLKQLLQAENIDDKRWPARTLAGLIDGWKNRGLMPSQVPPGEAAVFGNGKGGKLYASYQERL